MKLLVLGGTKFLGRALTEAALGRGHRVTLLNRGRTNPGLYPGVETPTTTAARPRGRPCCR
jgi:2'-hydroxyisoflavone reductase